MPVHAGLLRLSTPGDGAIADVTEGVRSVLSRSGLQLGVVTVFVTGSTAAITTMEHEPGGIADLQELLERLIPAAREGDDYAHNVRNHDSNAHAHLRAALVGPSVSVPFAAGEMALGTWQQIVLLDFDDRPRDRQISVQVVGE
jgi:secondary thiamine-phosphate synthase enzyme